MSDETSNDPTQHPLWSAFDKWFRRYTGNLPPVIDENHEEDIARWEAFKAGAQAGRKAAVDAEIALTKSVKPWDGGPVVPKVNFGSGDR